MSGGAERGWGSEAAGRDGARLACVACKDLRRQINKNPTG